MTSDGADRDDTGPSDSVERVIPGGTRDLGAFIVRPRAWRRSAAPAGRTTASWAGTSSPATRTACGAPGTPGETMTPPGSRRSLAASRKGCPRRVRERRLAENRTEDSPGAPS